MQKHIFAVEHLCTGRACRFAENDIWGGFFYCAVYVLIVGAARLDFCGQEERRHPSTDGLCIRRTKDPIISERQRQRHFPGSGEFSA